MKRGYFFADSIMSPGATHGQQINRIAETHEWCIENFTNLLSESGDSIKSPKFHSNSDNKDRWYMQLYPRGRDKICQDYLSLYLILKSTVRQGVDVYLEIFLKKASTGEKIWRKQTEKKFLNEMSCGWRAFAKRTDVLTECLQNDKLKIYCKFDFAMQQENNTSNFVYNDVPLSQSLWQYFEKSQFTDVIISVQKTKFHAHKMVLVARSSVFAEHFVLHADNANTPVYHINELQPEVVRAMLQFIYTNNVNNICNMAEELMKAAEYYKLKGLKTLCEQELIKKLDVTNAAELLIISAKFNSLDLQHEVTKFINNNLKEVTETMGYKILEQNHAILLGHLLRAQVAEQQLKIQETTDEIA